MRHRIAAAGVALAHLFPVALVAVVVFLAGCQAFDGSTRIGTPIGVTYEHTGPPAPPAPQVVDDGIHALLQLHEPVAYDGRIANATFCDAIEAKGYGEGHATWQLHCRLPQDAPRAPVSAPESAAPTTHVVAPSALRQAQDALADAVEHANALQGEVDRLNDVIDTYGTDVRGKANEIEKLRGKMALLINPTDCRPMNAAGTELRCPNPEGVSDE